ncbi:MAG: C25 family cysteine peptidase [Candidatus Cloacimonetes bacterium]|nr:C25 family cysteine peptidase [Candidatus Cloacimonadota bacterium]
MKKILLTVLLMANLMLIAGNTQISIQSDNPFFNRSSDFLSIELENAIYPAKPGKPMLPLIPVTLLLPPGEKASTIQVTLENEQIYHLDKLIEPGQTPVPISQRHLAEFTEPDPEIYQKDMPYPSETHDNISTHYFRGHSIFTTNICPWSYNPVTSELKYYSNISITINSETTEESMTAFSQMYKSTEKTRNQLSSLVMNQNDINQYPLSFSRNNERLLLIITAESQLSNFEDFYNLKVKQGYNPILTSVEEIYASQTGVDNQDKIRNYIIQCYQNNDTEYVLLGGDTEFVPYRSFSVTAGNTIDHDLPSDMYFSNLDRVGTGAGPDWNTNNNNYWGEVQEADFYPEVAIGRISADSAAEFAAALNKQQMYQMSPVIADIEKALMVGENLNDSPMTWGGDYKDQIVTGGTFDGYYTTGISDNFSVSTLYERDTNWTRETLRNHMNAGINLLNHLGHSSTTFNMKFTNSTVTNNEITVNGIDHNYFIIYTQGCYPGAFDNRDYNGSYGEDCIAEKFTTIENGVAVFVGNTRYGWYMPGGTDSSSQYFDRQFFHALFDTENTKVSEANNYSKIQGISQCADDPWFRWTFYELTVFGDPTLDAWTSVPSIFTPQYPESIPISANSIEINVGVENALVGISRNGQNLFNGRTDESGIITAFFLQPFETIDELDIYISKHNYLTHTGSIIISPSDNPYIILNNFGVIAGDNDVVEYGESASIDLELKNVGTEISTNTQVTINIVNNPYITLNNNQLEIGDINPDETISIEDAFSFEVSHSVPDGYSFSFSLIIESDEDSWTRSITLNAFAPVLSIGELEIMNTNHTLLPGEQSPVSLVIKNTGGASANNVIVEIADNDPFISFESNESNIPLLISGAEESVIFNLTVSESASLGYMSLLDCILTADNGIEGEGTLFITIGYMGEDFETGDFSQYDWEFAGEQEWVIVSNESHEGSYSAKSGTITHNQTSTMSLGINVLQSGELSFYKKVSSENDINNNNYDYLSFSIDGTEMDRWDGQIDWSIASYLLTTGYHTLTWTYKKDPAVSNGSDCGWIDTIKFPPSVFSTSLPEYFCDTNQFDLGDIEISIPVTQYFSVFNFGAAELTGNISTPEGFTIALVEYQRSRKSVRTNTSVERNNIDYSIPSYGSQQFMFTFVPEVAGSLEEQILITSNDPFNNADLIQISAVVIPTEANESNNPTYKTEIVGNYPNPFNPSTRIVFSLAEQTQVKIEIFNVKGQKVTTLLDEVRIHGEHDIVWNGKDDSGKSVSSDVYFYKMKAGSKEFVKKMVLLK